jgi:hypothetical protein
MKPAWPREQETLFERHRANPLLTAEEWPYAVNNVVFPCGHTIQPDGDTLRLYYGAADTCIALATGSIRQMLDWLDRHGQDPTLGVD